MVWRSIFDHGGCFFYVIQGRGCVFSVQLSIETTLERLVLKNAAQRTSQHVKSPSGAQLMTTFVWFTYKLSFLSFLTIGSVLELLVLKNAAQRTSQRLKWTSGA